MIRMSGIVIILKSTFNQFNNIVHTFYKTIVETCIIVFSISFIFGFICQGSQYKEELDDKNVWYCHHLKKYFTCKSYIEYIFELEETLYIWLYMSKISI